MRISHYDTIIFILLPKLALLNLIWRELQVTNQKNKKRFELWFDKPGRLRKGFNELGPEREREREQ